MKLKLTNFDVDLILNLIVSAHTSTRKFYQEILVYNRIYEIQVMVANSSDSSNIVKSTDLYYSQETEIFQIVGELY